MKTKYIILSLAAALFITACAKDEQDHYLGNVKVSSSYVTLPLEGGTKTITIDATTDWTFDFDIDVDTTYVDPQKGNHTETIVRNQLTQFYEIDSLDATTGKEVITHWLSIAPASGGKGKTEVTFTALPRKLAKQVTVYLKAGDQIQTIIVQRGVAGVEEATVKQVSEGPDGKTFRVKGVCTRIASTSYGNWYLKDATVDGSTVKELYIYGTVDATGKYNWASFNIEVGDVVTVEGPKTNYNGTIELVDAVFIKVEKALLAADKTSVTIEKDEAPFTLSFTNAGTSLTFESKANWLHVEPEFIVNEKGKTILNVSADANTGDRRTGDIWLKASKVTLNKKGEPQKDSTEITVSVTQLGNTAEGNLLAIRNIIAPGSSSNRKNFDFTIGKATVTFVSGSNIFIEDESAGLLIYSSDVKLSVGQTVEGRVFGQGYAYNGLPEATVFDMSMATVNAAPKLSSELPKPKKVTLAELNTKWNDYFCRYIEVDNAVVQADTVAARYEFILTNEDGTPQTELYKGAWQYKKSSGDRTGEVAEDANGTNKIKVNVQCKKYLNMDKDKIYNIVGTACYNKSNQIYIWDPSNVKEVKAE